MEHGFAIFFFIFGGVIFFYGLLMLLTGDFALIPYHSRISVSLADPKTYTRQVGKVVMLTALAPILSAASDYIPRLHNTLAPLILFPLLLTLFIWLGVKLVRKNLPY